MDADTPVTLTDKAAAKILEFREAEEAHKGKPLRVVVRGGGCAGYTQELYFDDARPDIDRRYVVNGVEVIIDEMSLMFLAGTTIDYVDGLQGSGFKFDNPNAKSTCGCGSSFST